jgi:transposase InsO family protein
LSRFEGILCCRSTTASTRCSRPDALVSASLFAASRRQPIAPGGRQRAAEEVQDLSDRFLLRRHRRSATAQGKLYLFVAIDRTSKFAVAQLVHKANMQAARTFLEVLVAAVPYRVEIVLTDNGIQFADLPKNRSGPTAKFRGHPFDRVCREHGIEHRLTQPNHPWTNGQVERMNRTIKDATVKRYHYESNGQLVRHLDDFVAAYNFARRLKTLNGLTPYEFICKRWTIEPKRFSLNPLQQMPGLNT